MSEASRTQSAVARADALVALVENELKMLCLSLAKAAGRDDLRKSAAHGFDLAKLAEAANAGFRKLADDQDRIRRRLDEIDAADRAARLGWIH